MSHAEKSDERRLLLERKVEIENSVKLGTNERVPPDLCEEYLRILEALGELI